MGCGSVRTLLHAPIDIINQVPRLFRPSVLDCDGEIVPREALDGVVHQEVVFFAAIPFHISRVEPIAGGAVCHSLRQNNYQTIMAEIGYEYSLSSHEEKHSVYPVDGFVTRAKTKTIRVATALEGQDLAGPLYRLCNGDQGVL